MRKSLESKVIVKVKSREPKLSVPTLHPTILYILEKAMLPEDLMEALFSFFSTIDFHLSTYRYFISLNVIFQNHFAEPMFDKTGKRRDHHLCKSSLSQILANIPFLYTVWKQKNRGFVMFSDGMK